MVTIYSITNKTNGRVYVGGTSRDIAQRWREHLYPSIKKELSEDLRALGAANFEFRVLEVVPPEKAWATERRWITQLKALKPHGYNTLLRDFVLG